MSKQEAQAVWNRLRSGFLGIERDLKEIVENRLWEPLGYTSFVEAWEAELAGIKLAGSIQASAVLSLFSAGATVEEVASVVDGVGPQKVKAYEQAFKAGFEPKDAYEHALAMSREKPEEGETWVEAHTRRPATKRNEVRLEGFSDEEMERWKGYCDGNNSRFRDFAKQIFREAMDNAVGR